ncbi:MAG: hypothetical protein WC755_01715 [Candidatus Woesearchaeota archaeon]
MAEPSKIIYEDASCAVTFGGSAQFHVKIISKEKVSHSSLMSPDNFCHMFFVANFAATSAFEILSAQGTNILVNNESDNYCIDVIPRKENDGLNFSWQMGKQADPVELNDIASKIKDELFLLEQAEKNKSKPVEKLYESSKDKVKETDKDIKKDDNSKKMSLGKVIIDHIPSVPSELLDEHEKITPNKNADDNYLLHELRRIP